MAETIEDLNKLNNIELIGLMPARPPDTREQCKLLLEERHVNEVTTAIERLRDTIDKHEQTATRLGKILNKLTFWIIVATFVGAVAAIAGVVVTFVLG